MVVLNVLDFINVRKESSVQFFSCAVLCYNTYYFEHVQNVFRCSVVQMVLLARSHIIVNAVNSFQVTDNILAIHSSAFFFYSNFYSPKDLTPHPKTSHHTQTGWSLFYSMLFLRSKAVFEWFSRTKQCTTILQMPVQQSWCSRALTTISYPCNTNFSERL